MSHRHSFLDHQVLSHFQCPFQLDPSAPYCTFYESSAATGSQTNGHPKRCPFGHLKSSPQEDSTLREIPSYICHDYLLGPKLCKNAVIGGGGAQNGNSSSQNSNTVFRCSMGFHPTLEELVDLDHLHQKMASFILLGDQQPTKNISLGSNKEAEVNGNPTSEANINTDGPQCTICLEHLTEESHKNFGILQNCTHIFCADCILTWQQRPRPDGQRGPNRKCPMCRTPSHKIVICQVLPRGGEEKKRLFEQQYRCFKLSSKAHKSSPVHSDTESTSDGSADSDASDDDDDDEDNSDSDGNDSDDHGMFAQEFLQVLGRFLDHTGRLRWEDREIRRGEEEDEVDGVRPGGAGGDGESHIDDLINEFPDLMHDN